MWSVHILCKNWKTIFKQWYLKTSSVICSELLSEGARLKILEVGTLTTVWNKVSGTGGRKHTVKFQADVGFLYSAASLTPVCSAQTWLEVHSCLKNYFLCPHGSLWFLHNWSCDLWPAILHASMCNTINQMFVLGGGYVIVSVLLCRYSFSHK